MQRYPKRLLYPCSTDEDRRTGDMVNTHLRPYSDAEFRREDDTGRSIREASSLRVRGGGAEQVTCAADGHMIMYVHRHQRRAVRSMLTTELLAAVDAYDLGMVSYQLLHDMATGNITGK